MTSLATLRRRRAETSLALDRAQTRKTGGIGETRRLFVIATAQLLRAELNHRIAKPLLRARAPRQQTGDLFAQIGA